MMRTLPTTVLATTLIATAACSLDAPTDDLPGPTRPPNILLLVADDLGYSDLGFLGSEIRTPNLDALAAQGRVLTNYHVTPTCSPTRAMLLTGVDAHPAGLGTMAGDAAENQGGQPGYEGMLSDRVVTVATLLRDAGYLTAITGKWHLGESDTTRPENRGFERSFVLLPGGASHFADRRRLGTDGTPAPYLENGIEVELPTDFYSSDFYTDKLIEYLGAARDQDRPFFAIAAFTAPHWPLQATDDYIDRYRGVYDEGWDVLRARRVQGLKDAGAVDADIAVPARQPWVAPWESLPEEQRRVETREMELFAAMVENLDANIGRLLEVLAEIGEIDNTFIMFSSDNGAEGNPVKDTDWSWKEYDNSFANLGRPGSYVAYSPGWAQAATAPFRLFKTFPTEGGTRVPAIVRLPGSDAWVGLDAVSSPGRPGGGQVPARGDTSGQRGATSALGQRGNTSASVQLDDTFASVKDVAPTALALAGVSHPGDVYQGRDVATLEGASLLPFLRGETRQIHPSDYTIGWELFGRRALRHGDWKLVWLWEPYGPERWALYDLAADPSESIDLADREPDRVEDLRALWDAYARRNGVILPPADSSYARLPTGR